MRLFAIANQCQPASSTFMLTASEQSHGELEFYERLVDWDEQACRKILRRLRENEGLSALSLCKSLTEAFHTVGEAWKCEELTVYQEHIASQIGYRLLLDLLSTLSSTENNAPMAIGCTPEHDPYILPTTMVEIVLRELGWRAQSVGTNLPLEMLAPAIDDVQPQLCWVSVSHIDCQARLREQLSFLSEIGRDRGVRVICGGQALVDELKHGHNGIMFLTQLSELEEHAARGW